MSFSFKKTKIQTLASNIRQETTQRPFWRYPLWLLTALLAVCIGYFIFVPAQFEVRISPLLVQPRSGQAVVVPIYAISSWGFEVRSDDIARHGSRLRLLEDGRELGPAGTLHNEISEKGHGRFSYWDGYLVFSSSDGSDPRTNGRTYVARAPIVMTTTVSVAVWLSLFGLIFLSWLDFTIPIELWRSGALKPAFTAAVSLRPDELNHISRQRGHIPELDGIRGYACISVLLAHCLIGIIESPDGSFLYALQGYSLQLLLGGVDLFFVLSGFLIGGILIDSRKSLHYFKSFWIRRVCRIMPVAYLLLATYGIALLARANFNLPWADGWLLAEPKPPLWTFATFMQSFPIAAGGYGGPRWMGITWSLAIEEQFYMIFPFAVYFLSRRSITLTALAAIAASPVLRDLFERLYGNWYAAYVLLPSRLDGLMFGVLGAVIVRTPLALAAAVRLRWFLDALALYIAYIIATNDPILQIWPSPTGGPFPPLKQSLFALMFAIVILRIFLYRRSILNSVFRSSLLGKAGLISYALYMYHQFVNGLMHGFIFNQEPKVGSAAELMVSILVMAIATGLATLSYFFLERPIRRWGQRISSPWQSKDADSIAHAHAVY